MGKCHSKEQKNIKVNYPSGLQLIFQLKPSYSVANLFQKIFEEAPMTAVEDKIIPGQQVLISKSKPEIKIKFSEEKLYGVGILNDDEYNLSKSELQISNNYKLK